MWLVSFLGLMKLKNNGFPCEFSSPPLRHAEEVFADLAGPGDCCVPPKFLLAAGADRAEGPAPLRLVCEVCAPSQGLQGSLS